MMVDTARSLAAALDAAGVPVFARVRGGTQSHQLAVETARYGGGQSAAKRLRRANLLACGIGLPMPPVEGDVNGLRLGTPEIVRWGMTPEDMGKLARLIARTLAGNEDPAAIASQVTAFRRRFATLRFVR